jgi:hypothetical protein
MQLLLFSRADEVRGREFGQCFSANDSSAPGDQLRHAPTHTGAEDCIEFLSPGRFAEIVIHADGQATLLIALSGVRGEATTTS